MPSRTVRTGLTVVALAALAACDLNTFTPALTRPVGSIKIVGQGACAVQSECEFRVDAWDVDGNPTTATSVTWTSSNVFVATVSGHGSMATVTGRQGGTTTIKAVENTSRSTDQVTITVAPLKQ